jgi:hypothetical protein
MNDICGYVIERHRIVRIYLEDVNIDGTLMKYYSIYNK